MAGADILFFDVDGTLFDYGAGVNQRLIELHRRFQLRLSSPRQADFLDAYWRITDRMDRGYLLHGPLDQAQTGASPESRFTELCQTLSIKDNSLPAEMAQAYRTEPLAGRLFDGVAPALAMLRRRWRLGIITDGPENPQRTRLSQAQIEQMFDPIVASPSAGAAKPDPRLFQAALDRAGVPAARAVMIGNHPLLDLVSPAKLGMSTVLFTGGRRLATISRFAPFIHRMAHSWDVLPKEIAELATSNRR